MRVVALLFAALLVALPCRAASITVLATASAAPPARMLAEGFTRETGTTVTFGGLRPADVVAAIKAGHPGDVLLMPTRSFGAIAPLLEPGSVAPLVRIAVGVAVPLGVSRPDIATPQAFRAALLAAPRGVAYSDPAIGSSAGPIIEAILMGPDYAGVKRRPVKDVAISALKSGEADIALQMITELADNPAVQLVGPVPEEIGAAVEVSAGVVAGAPPEAAAFVRYLVRPQSAAIWKAGRVTPLH